ncbi:MAG: hypothetical protein KatS3mg027_0241 [Bacteroidia bacterium]|nr:MAG: hypothetical protein KatS3mg027_0241 [Bacteroidia bacterium]
MNFLKGIVLLILLYHSLFFHAQQDSIVESRKEGLYLDYLQFRENRPITKSQIITSIDTAQLDFFTKVVSQKEILIMTPLGTEEKISPKDLWGYFQNGILYIYYDNAFYKVPVLGAISYFIGTQEVTYYSGVGWGYPYGMAGVPVKTREIKDFLMDYYTGKVYPFSLDQLEELFKKDPAIYNEFTQLSRKQKKNKYRYYIRLFNEKYPVR